MPIIELLGTWVVGLLEPVARSVLGATGGDTMFIRFLETALGVVGFGGFGGW